MGRKDISSAVIQRLPRYYRYLNELKEEGVERISSKELSERMRVTASQIRQDLNQFGGFGQQGYGYNVDFLHNEIGRILGLYRQYRMIIVGAGNIGQALAKYQDFKRLGFLVTGLFDIEPKLIGKMVGNNEIMDVSRLRDFIAGNPVDIAIIAVQKSEAEQVAASLTELGIKAIWNFAPVDLNLKEDVVVENVHLSESLIKLAYLMGEEEK